ncbi:MAG: M48 family metalloprotease [Longimicrobiales bacterium]|nr:M48 family metalloprotease [Longimicrobiales bacterium]
MRARSLTGLAAAALLTACMPIQNIGPRGLINIGASALPIGPEREQQIGFGIAATVAGRYSVVDDPELNRYVNLVGQAVAQQSIRYGEIPFRFAVLDTEDVNAFAAPGGYIFVTRGALGMMETEADLAGVLAHEVAHVDQKHVLDEIRRSSVMQSAREETGLDAAILDRLAELGGSMLFMGLSREDEMESDSLGVLYAVGTGYQAAGLVRFLENLVAAEQAEGEPSEGMKEWLATHPSTAERLEAVRAYIERIGVDPQTGQAVPDRFRRYVGGG